MSDHDNSDFFSLLFLDLGNSLLDLGFTFWVKRASGFVEDQDLRLLDQSSCDCNSLFLTTR